MRTRRKKLDFSFTQKVVNLFKICILFRLQSLPCPVKLVYLITIKKYKKEQ